MKYLKVLIFLLFSLLVLNVNSSSIKIENVFNDINSDYKYYTELQDLYNKKVIFPDLDGNFNPEKLLKRDEFVGIALEVGCEKCIKPNETNELRQKYENKEIFFDLEKDNKYFYCIGLAKEKNIIKGYDKGYKCTNGKSQNDKSPFCPENNISLEEAVAMILRISNIFTIENNNEIINKIKSGEITKNLSNDVGVKNKDGSVYTFYGYLQKALEYEIKEFDSKGNEKIYKLLSLENGKINPKKLITKQDFLKMSYIALKINSCKNLFENKLPVKIDILSKRCSSNNEKCMLANFNLPNENTFDFKGETQIKNCDLGMEENNSYMWKFFNKENGKEIVKYGKYLDNFKLENGSWEIYLNVFDKCGNISEASSSIYIGEKNDKKGLLSLGIDSNKIVGTPPMILDFSSNVGGGDGEYSYLWSFGDGENLNGKNISKVFKENGIYKVDLFVHDKIGKTGKASLVIEIDGDKICQGKDNDKDGVNDCDDLCPLIEGEVINDGCPIIKKCGKDCSCNKGEICNLKIKGVCEENGICIKDDSFVGEYKTHTEKCLEKENKNNIYGNVACNSCPCSKFIDFLASVRKCDLIFPTINSKDGKEIFSAGKTIEYKEK